MKSIPFAVQYHPGQVAGRVDHLSNAILESVGGGKEQAPVESDGDHPAYLFVVGMLGQFAEDFGAGLPAEQTAMWCG